MRTPEVKIDQLERQKPLPGFESLLGQEGDQFILFGFEREIKVSDFEINREVNSHPKDSSE